MRSRASAEMLRVFGSVQARDGGAAGVCTHVACSGNASVSPVMAVRRLFPRKAGQSSADETRAVKIRIRHIRVVIMAREHSRAAVACKTPQMRVAPALQLDICGHCSYIFIKDRECLWMPVLFRDMNTAPGEE